MLLVMLTQLTPETYEPAAHSGVQAAWLFNLVKKPSGQSWQRSLGFLYTSGAVHGSVSVVVTVVVALQPSELHESAVAVTAIE